MARRPSQGTREIVSDSRLIPIHWSRCSLAVFTLGLILVPRVAMPQYTSFLHDPRNILEGSWQSCREADGRYTERVYDHVVNGAGQFEVHLGPGNEFAMFTGVQPEHRDHASPDNL